MKKLFIASLIFFGLAIATMVSRMFVTAQTLPVNTNWGFGMMGQSGVSYRSSCHSQSALASYEWYYQRSNDTTQDLADTYLAELMTTTDWDALTAAETRATLNDYYEATRDYIIDLWEKE